MVTLPEKAQRKSSGQKGSDKHQCWRSQHPERDEEGTSRFMSGAKASQEKGRTGLKVDHRHRTYSQEKPFRPRRECASWISNCGEIPELDKKSFSKMSGVSIGEVRSELRGGCANGHWGNSSMKLDCSRKERDKPELPDSKDHQAYQIGETWIG